MFFQVWYNESRNHEFVKVGTIVKHFQKVKQRDYIINWMDCGWINIYIASLIESTHALCQPFMIEWVIFSTVIYKFLITLPISFGLFKIVYFL